MVIPLVPRNPHGSPNPSGLLSARSASGVFRVDRRLSEPVWLIDRVFRALTGRSTGRRNSVMTVSAARTQREDLAGELFDVLTRLGLGSSRSRRRDGDLKELEYRTLALLQRRKTMTVGDIQRRLGVLPAQMSRILRGLESRDRPLIACRIHPDDKRKINVLLTPAGSKALRSFQTVQVRRLSELLVHLPTEDIEGLHRLLAHIRERLSPPRPAVAETSH
jgi:DNA-binding MarR family transcriptional regulator